MSFPNKTPDETKLLTFDFSPEAAEGTTLAAPVITVEIVGEIGEIADLTIGTPVITDALDDDGNVVTGHESQWVQVLVGGGIDGAKYWMQCEADASNGEHHRVDRTLPVKAKAALVV